MMDREYLKYAIVELTAKCNLACNHCYNWWKLPEVQPYPESSSYTQAFRLLTYLFEKTTVEHIVFTGGEPTLSERFTELVLHALVHGCKVTVITNGNGPLQVYGELFQLPLHRVEISLHSSERETHDRITGITGSFDKALCTLRTAIRNRIRVTPVVVLTTSNCSQAVETARFLIEEGADSILFNRYNIGGNGLKHSYSLSASSRELQKAFAGLNELAGIQPVHISSGVCSPHCLLDPDLYPNIHFGNCPIHPYRRPLTFDTEGNLRLCNHSPVIAGNIYHQPLGEVLFNSYCEKWNSLELSYCHPCSRLSRCRGGCRAASEQAGLSLDHEDPIVKELGGIPYFINAL